MLLFDCVYVILIKQVCKATHTRTHTHTPRYLHIYTPLHPYTPLHTRACYVETKSCLVMQVCEVAILAVCVDWHSIA